MGQPVWAALGPAQSPLGALDAMRASDDDDGAGPSGARGHYSPALRSCLQGFGTGAAPQQQQQQHRGADSLAAAAPPAAGLGAAHVGGQLLRFTLTVPFRSGVEAEMARRSLLPDAQGHQGLVQKEIFVDGTTLAVRWAAEDPMLFRVSVGAFLDKLSLVVRNIRRFGTPPLA
ncbi:EKC/KEOPS complex subunit LAGE3-like [Erinaceus europaeus]|uniref:EKC/KEOPS complex subunit LAGE3-like n=1 Tax=Erinaceus europaeus TaxID=9365 RepID=A0ABM3WS62_ERIEU|nr:EKC/KEOPS complex subunit LAGE3-like [Erinaceus europaeus]XP_060039412.1 EKC/KEOPS complex subunit LAGE3-like [Erinaceus europaeus]